MMHAGPHAAPVSIVRSECAIVARGLRKSYAGRAALDGLDLAVPAGSVFGLLGPNGAGKSTAVRVLTTLTRPEEGSASVAGYDVVRAADAVRRTIGCVAQAGGRDPDATGRENLRLQGQLYGARGRSLELRVDDLLDRFGLADAANRPARTYSGGMQRRLDIAMGLVHRPSVLFLDEPTTGLDPEVRAKLWEEIARLASDEGSTVLLTTHYLDEADRLAGRLAIMDRGRVVVEGTPDELKAGLRGDAVHVELAAASDGGAAQRALRPLPGVADVAVEARTVHARVGHGASAAPAIVAALDAAGVGVASLTIARPSLDDVYLRYAGRSFHHADIPAVQEEKAS